MGTVGNVNEMLDGHVVLDLECLDRIYLNAYVPTLRVGGQVATFFNKQRNQPIASPSLFQQMGEAFRQAVAVFAKRHKIPVVRFRKDDRKIGLIRPLFEAVQGPGVVAIGVAQEFQSVLTAYNRTAKQVRPAQWKAPYYAFVTARRSRNQTCVPAPRTMRLVDNAALKGAETPCRSLSPSIRRISRYALRVRSSGRSRHASTYRARRRHEPLPVV